MKKLLFLALLLAAAMFALAACNRGGNDGGEEGPAATATPTATPAAQTPATPEPPQAAPPGSREYLIERASAMSAPEGSHVVIATATNVTADILDSAWSNPSPLGQLRELVFGGLGTMARNHFNEFFPNPMVLVDGAMPQIRTNDDGSRTYTFTIYTDNQFSDGTYITAHHYAGGVALAVSPLWASVVPSALGMFELQHRALFQTGEITELPSVRIYNDSQFSVTIRAEGFPNVWEISAYMSYGPTALHMYGVEAHDNGNGVFLTALGGGVMTNEAFHAIIEGGHAGYVLGPDGEPLEDANGNRTPIGTGIRYRPTVFSGPYMFESVDVGNGTASVVVNPYFRSTWDGYRPRIERIYWRLVPLPLMVDALAAGEAHIADNVGDGMMIENALSVLVGAGTHSFVTYDGTTQLFAQFHVDTGPTQFRAVRQAMSFMVDRHRVAEEVTRGFGVVVHGPWATPWWWYQAAADLDLYDRIKIYDLNIAEAIRLLEEDGWVYDAQGNPYTGDALSDSNNIRHKWVDEWVWGDADGNPAESVTDIVRLVRGADNEWSHSNIVYTGERVLMPLIINWMVRAIDYPFRDSLEVQLYDNMAAAGGRLIQERSANWGTYLQTGYRQEDRFEFHTLGIIPAIAWSPWFNADLAAIPSQNWHQADDPEYRRLADNVRAQDITTPEGRDAFVEAFTQYMVFRTYEAYTLPFSVSLTHDFFPVGLGGWFNNSFWRPEQAVQRAYWR